MVIAAYAGTGKTFFAGAYPDKAIDLCSMSFQRILPENREWAYEMARDCYEDPLADVRLADAEEIQSIESFCAATSQESRKRIFRHVGTKKEMVEYEINL